MKQICHCGNNKVKEICVSYICVKDKRFCCKECAKTDEYMNHKLLMKKFNKDIKDLKENRYQQILYLFNQFKSFQQQLISNQKKEEVFELFLKALQHQEILNQQEHFREIENKIININEFFNLTETDIQFILKIRCLQHDNDQLLQVLSSLQNIEQIKYSNLLINLNIIITQSMRVKVFQIQAKCKFGGLRVGKYIYCEDKMIYSTNYSYLNQQGSLLQSNLMKKNANKVIKVNGIIQKILITSKLIFCNTILSESHCCFFGFSKINNQKKQFQIFLKFSNSERDFFKLISKSLVILNQVGKKQFRLFCYKTKKIVNIIRKKSLIINYSSIFNQLIIIENKKLNFYNFNTKSLKNKIVIPLLEDHYQYITNKQELITCLYQVTVQKIDFKKQKASIFKQFEASQFVYNELHDYLIIFNYYNEIMIFDSNYFLIKRFRWDQFLFSNISEFIVNNDMKYIFLRNSDSEVNLTIYRCQIAI